MRVWRTCLKTIKKQVKKIHALSWMSSLILTYHECSLLIRVWVFLSWLHILQAIVKQLNPYIAKKSLECGIKPSCFNGLLKKRDCFHNSSAEYSKNRVTEIYKLKCKKEPKSICKSCSQKVSTQRIYQTILHSEHVMPKLYNIGLKCNHLWQLKYIPFFFRIQKLQNVRYI